MPEKLKVYILARKDAPIGKVMAHVGHVCCDLMDGLGSNIRIENWYYENDQTKIVLQVKDEKKLNIWFNRFCDSKHDYFTLCDIHTKQRYCIATEPLTDAEAKDLGLKKLRLFG